MGNAEASENVSCGFLLSSRGDSCLICAVPLLDVLGSVAFSPVKNDMLHNVKVRSQVSNPRVPRLKLSTEVLIQCH